MKGKQQKISTYKKKAKKTFSQIVNNTKRVNSMLFLWTGYTIKNETNISRQYGQFLALNLKFAFNFLYFMFNQEVVKSPEKSIVFICQDILVIQFDFVLLTFENMSENSGFISLFLYGYKIDPKVGFYICNWVVLASIHFTYPFHKKMGVEGIKPHPLFILLTFRSWASCTLIFTVAKKVISNCIVIFSW